MFFESDFLISQLIVQSLSPVPLLATLWTAACQASLSFAISQSLLRLMSIESVMLSNHLILCCPYLLLPSIFPSIRVFSSELALHHIRWPEYWSFSFSISPSNEYSGLISFRNDCVAYCSCIVTFEIRKCESSIFLLLFHPHERGCLLVPLHFMPLEWYYLHI